MRVEDVAHPPQVGEASSDELNTLNKTEAYKESASQGFTLEEQKRIMRKVDWRVVPLLTFLSLVSFIDRSNTKSSYRFALMGIEPINTLQSETQRLLV